MEEDENKQEEHSASPEPEANEEASGLADESGAGAEGISDILEQDDIDSLLQQMSSDEPEPVVASGEAAGDEDAEGIIFSYPRKRGEPLVIEPYDFRNPAFLGEMQMRRLRLMHEDFIRFLEARITLFLRCDFSLKMTYLSTKSYDQVVDEVDNPTHLVLFRVPPMPGVGFIEMSPNLALTIASSILGGKGHAPRLERYLTQIEIDLIEDFLSVLLDEWAQRWELSGEKLEPEIIGHEIVASVLQICEHDTVMFSLMMDAALRGASGRMGISVPLFMIEEPIRKLQEKRAEDGEKRKTKKQTWRPLYGEIMVPGEVTFPLGSVAVKEALNWEVGTVLPIEESTLDQVVLKLAGIPLFEGKAGIDNENRAIQIEGRSKKKEPIWQMKT